MASPPPPSSSSSSTTSAKEVDIPPGSALWQRLSFHFGDKLLDASRSGKIHNVDRLLTKYREYIPLEVFEYALGLAISYKQGSIVNQLLQDPLAADIRLVQILRRVGYDIDTDLLLRLMRARSAEDVTDDNREAFLGAIIYPKCTAEMLKVFVDEGGVDPSVDDNRALLRAVGVNTDALNYLLEDKRVIARGLDKALAKAVDESKVIVAESSFKAGDSVARQAYAWVAQTERAKLAVERLIAKGADPDAQHDSAKSDEERTKRAVETSYVESKNPNAEHDSVKRQRNAYDRPLIDGRVRSLITQL